MSPTAVQPVHVRTPTKEASALSQAIRTWCLFLSIAAIGAGVYMRAWLLWHRALSSDEAVAGLMGRHILHGHFFAFYWGQVYGGVEPYLTAAGFGIFGTSAWVIRAIPILLSIGAALLTWRITKRLVNDSMLAVLAGALVWAVPTSAVSNSYIEWGFRGVTLLCGLAILLFALRILDGKDQWWNFAFLGLFVGIGWWSSPELVYYLIAAGLIIGAFAWSRRRNLTGLLLSLGVLVATTAIGMLPWLWANANSGFKSLKTSSFGAPPHPINYHGRLSQFFHFSLGMLFSLRDLFDGRWLGGKRVGEILLVLVLTALGIAMVLAVIRGGRAIALVATVILFPFVMAVSPATWYWQGGRYTGYVVPLYVMIFCVGAFAIERVVSSRKAPSGGALGSSAGRITLSAVGAFLIAMALLSFVKDPTPGYSLSSAWDDPNKPSTAVIHTLEKAGVKYGYANYWVAYRLDLLTKEKMTITVGRGDFDRWPPYTRRVEAQPEAAWIFVQPTQAAINQWLDLAGPGGTSEAGFIQQLKADSIGYKVIDAGTLDAVIPTSPIAPDNFWGH